MADCVVVHPSSIEQELSKREKSYEKSYDPSEAATVRSSETDPSGNCSRTNGLDPSEDGSECEPGQQWTQVRRPANARHSQKNKANLIVGVQQNGLHELGSTRSRSFHGLKEENKIHRPLGVSPLPSNKSGLQGACIVNGTSAHSQSSCSTSPSDLAVDVEKDRASPVVQDPAISSSPAISPLDSCHSLHTGEYDSTVRLQGGYFRGRKTFRQMGEASDRNRILRQHQASPPTCMSSDVAHSTASQPNAVHIICRPVSPAGLTARVNSFHSDSGRRNLPAWRRPHYSMPYGARAPFPQRLHGPGQGAPRPYHNQCRHQPGVSFGPNGSSLEFNDKVKESTPVTTAASTKRNPVNAQPSTLGKGASWAATVAAAPPGAGKATKSPTICTDSLQSQLIPFLLNQWHLFCKPK